MRQNWVTLRLGRRDTVRVMRKLLRHLRAMEALALLCALVVLSVSIGGDLAAARPQLSPVCSRPATLKGHREDEVPTASVFLNEGFDPYKTARLLLQKYHFTLLIVVPGDRAFYATDINRAVIPLLQCEPSVKALL